MSKRETSLDSIAAGLIVILAILLLMAAFAHGETRHRQIALSASDLQALNQQKDAVTDAERKAEDERTKLERLRQNIVTAYSPGNEWDCLIEEHYIECSVDESGR